MWRASAGERVLRDLDQPGGRVLRTPRDRVLVRRRYERLDQAEPERRVVVDRRYVEVHAMTASRRLVKADIRLAALLNEALDESVN